MPYFRIDFKVDNSKVPFANTLLKWIIIFYVVPAMMYLTYKLFHLMTFGGVVAWYEWPAVILNLGLVIVLTRQLFRLNKIRYIIITDKGLKYAKHFPWDSFVSWKRFKQFQYGYSNVRLITKGGTRFRFSLLKISEEEKSKLFRILDGISKKYGVEMQQPVQ